MKKSACYLPLPLPLIPLFLVLNSKNTFLGFLEIDLCIIFSLFQKYLIFQMTPTTADCAPEYQTSQNPRNKRIGSQSKFFLL